MLNHRQRQGEPISAPPSATYTNCLQLCYAVLAQGLQDAINGDPGAQDWVNGPAFTYWCDWVDVDPAPLRRRLQDLAPRRFVIRHAPSGHPRGPRGGPGHGAGRARLTTPLPRARPSR